MGLKDSMRKLNRIYDGWKNVVFLSPTVEELAKVRAKICSKCPHAVKSTWTEAVGKLIKKMSGIKCDICNCPISAKVRSIKEECPHPEGAKW